MAPRIVALAPGDPLEPGTFSGTSRQLLLAADRRGGLAGTVDGYPRPLVLAEKAAAFAPDRERWRQWFNAGATPISPAVRSAMSRIAGRRVDAELERTGADAVFQFTGWFRPRPRRPVLRASYHDGNLATYLSRPDLRIDRSSRRVRRAMDWERALYDEMDLIFPMSDWLGRSFVEDFGQPPEKVVTAGAGANFDELPAVPHREWEVPRLLFVGKDWERKGGPAVLAAFAAVHAVHPDAELTIIGPTSLPVTPPRGVRFLGRLDRQIPEQAAQLEDAYRTATMFLMPSVYEPFGIAFLEAMSVGLLCIGGDSCAMPEIIEDGVTGHVVPAGDQDALSERIAALASDPGRCRAMGLAARERVVERFTWDAAAGRVLDAIGAAVQSSADRPMTRA